MSWLVASIGPGGMPSERAVTFAEPPGTIASAGTCPVGNSPGRPSRPLTTLLTVPSPPCTTTRSAPSLTAACAISPPWPRCRVCSTVNSRRLFSACASRSRPAVVVDVAVGLTIKTARMTPKPTGAGWLGWGGDRATPGQCAGGGTDRCCAGRDGVGAGCCSAISGLGGQISGWSTASAPQRGSLW